MQLEWWYWIIAGFCLIGLELIFPSFTIIWFGIGALAIGILKLFWPLFPVAGQLLLWLAASICFTLMWFKYLKPKNNRTNAGAPGEGLAGETGVVIRGTRNRRGRGIVRFRAPLMGADEWSCYSEDVLKVGDTVRVDTIEGGILRVTRI